MRIAGVGVGDIMWGLVLGGDTICDGSLSLALANAVATVSFSSQSSTSSESWLLRHMVSPVEWSDRLMRVALNVSDFPAN